MLANRSTKTHYLHCDVTEDWRACQRLAEPIHLSDGVRGGREERERRKEREGREGRKEGGRGKRAGKINNGLLK